VSIIASVVAIAISFSSFFLLMLLQLLGDDESWDVFSLHFVANW